MHYVISGTTSRTGYSVIKLLARKVGVENLTCLVRATSDITLLQQLGLNLHVADVVNPDSYSHILNPETIYIDMSLIRYYHYSLQALQKAAVKRAYFISTTAIFSHNQQFAKLYVENEAKIRDSGITYTLLRPSMIYGSLGDKNMHRLIKFLSRFPVFPVFDSGRSLMQPVFVEDLALAIVDAIDNPRTENKEYNLAGPESITYRDIIETITNQLKRKVYFVNINTRTAAAIVRLAQRIPLFPITEEQVLRLQENKCFDISKSVGDLNFRPRSFAEGIACEIQEMRSAGMIP